MSKGVYDSTKTELFEVDLDKVKKWLQICKEFRLTATIKWWSPLISSVIYISSNIAEDWQYGAHKQTPIP